MEHKEISNREFLFGDFDEDNVPNIDDIAPFDPDVRRSTHEIRLSDEFRELEGELDEHKENLDEFVVLLKRKTGKPVKHRVKNIPSLLNKLRRKLDVFGDIGGAKILANDMDELRKIDKELYEEFSTPSSPDRPIILKRENFFTLPGGKSGYRAVHYDFSYHGKPIEFQLKTKQMNELTKITHTAYKRGNVDPDTFSALSCLAWKADEGNKRARDILRQIRLTPEMITSPIDLGDDAKEVATCQRMEDWV